MLPDFHCAGAQCTVHGVACWFDVLFDGTQSKRWLSTAPGLPTTHWFAHLPTPTPICCKERGQQVLRRAPCMLAGSN